MLGRGSICCASLLSGGGSSANGHGGPATFDAAHDRLGVGFGNGAAEIFFWEHGTFFSWEHGTCFPFLGARHVHLLLGARHGAIFSGMRHVMIRLQDLARPRATAGDIRKIPGTLQYGQVRRKDTFSCCKENARDRGKKSRGSTRGGTSAEACINQRYPHAGPPPLGNEPDEYFHSPVRDNPENRISALTGRG